ncbi:hypothetical protein JW868_00940, partial [Candidatus Woesearchaeota archaeon]|nr:hypothetical protein [Candidatus Woesearchaeota archaeon]
VINDQKIDEAITHLILQIEDMVRDLQNALNVRDTATKELDMERIASLLSDTQLRLDQLIQDVGSIRNPNLQEKQFIFIDKEVGDRYLKDKTHQLFTMKEHVSNLYEISRENPSIAELNRGVIDTFIEQLNAIIDEINQIKIDDEYLREIYESKRAA